MNRTLYFSVIGVLALALFASISAKNTEHIQVSAPSATSTPTLNVVEVKHTEERVVPAVAAPRVAATTTVQENKKPSTQVQAPVEGTPNVQTAPSQDSFDSSAAALRSALVNILCYVPASSGLHSISGSGVFIDPKGIILTNAHIGQYFLLQDRGVSCSIRTGSPASDSYKAELMYVSSAWINANPTTLIEDSPSGTGEYDFALLAVTKSASQAPLPSLFPSVPLAVTPPKVFTPVVIASYGAQFLEASQIRSYLFPTIVFGSVKDIFTFGTNSVDVMSLGGSVAAQEGSSGGGVVSASEGVLVGTITTSTISGSTDTRTLSAITASYIRAQYERETASSLETLLTEPTSKAILDFSPEAKKLEAVLARHLP